jgi:hypothetical protein
MVENYTFEVELLKTPKYYLAIAAIFRDEARFLKEWIEFHKLMGVEHFYLYNHLSKDNYLKILNQYIEEGSVELINLTQETITPQDFVTLQCNVYLNAAQKTKQDVEWLAIIDTDEFLFPMKETNLTHVLKNYDSFASLSVNWRIFGSGNVDIVMKENLQMDPLVKTIVKPRYVETFINPHFAVLESGYAQVAEDYKFLYGPYSHFRSNEVLAINHYWARDWEFFNSTKLSRAHIISSLLSKEDQVIKTKALIEINKNYSTKFDDAILKFVPVLKEQISQKIYENSHKMVHASIFGRYEEVEACLLSDIDIDFYDQEIGITALYGAAENQHLNVASLLLKHSANPEIKAINGATPLFISVQNNDTFMTALLVNNDADIESSFQNITTPIGLAGLLGYEHLVEIMLHAN